MELNQLVWMPASGWESMGRVVMLRDNEWQVTVWVPGTDSSQPRTYWTWADQIEVVGCAECEDRIPLARGA